MSAKVPADTRRTRKNPLKSDDINRSSTTMWQEGTVLRMEEMTNRCITATGSAAGAVPVGMLRRGELVFGVKHASAFKICGGLYEPLIRQI